MATQIETKQLSYDLPMDSKTAWEMATEVRGFCSEYSDAQVNFSVDYEENLLTIFLTH